MTRCAILLVQADFLGAERLRLLLDQSGYQVAGVAGRTVDAIELVRRHRPELAIVDMMLELDVDGIRTATALAQGFGLKILITTGFPDFVTQAEGAADLACAVVRKPYTDEELLAAVARCLHPDTSDITASAPAVPRNPRPAIDKA
jgi:CheY-like chemotaxis protein